jgi:hypothetical protein
VEEHHVKNRLALLAAAGLALGVAAPAIAADGGPNAPRTADCTNSITGAKEGTFTFTAPEFSWPPNHKAHDFTASLTDEDADAPAVPGAPTPADPTDQAHIEMTGVSSQPDNGLGDGNTEDDVVVGDPGTGNPTATTTGQFTSERAGIPNDGDDPWGGRTYTFTLNGTTDGGASTCDAVTFTVTVPHDMRDKNSTDQ